MSPATDLRRVTFPTSGVTVTEHGPVRLSIVTVDWTLSLGAVDSKGAENIKSALRGVVARSRACREDVLTAQGAPIIQRILRGAQGSQRAVQAQYLISIGDDWIAGQAYSRTPGELFDVTAVDNLLLATRLAAPPRLEAEVIPAWRAYQRQIAPGSPVAKFVLYMDPAPVRLGNYQSGLHDTTLFTDSDFRRGGRQVSPDLIEFYTKDDPTSIRIDLWVDTHPHIEGRERIFEAKLRVEKPTVSIWSFGDPYDATILPGDYKVLLSLVNRGKSSEQSLTEEEWFSRSDLERYEVGLKRHASETDPEK